MGLVELVELVELELIQRLRRKQSKIKYKKIQLENLRARAYDVKSIGFNPEGKVQSGGVSNPTSKIDELIDLEREIVDEIKELYKEECYFIDCVGELEHKLHRDILVCRYVGNMAYKEVGEYLSYSTSHIKREHSKAIEKLELLEISSQ